MKVIKKIGRQDSGLNLLLMVVLSASSALSTSSFTMLARSVIACSATIRRTDSSERRLISDDIFYVSFVLRRNFNRRPLVGKRSVSNGRNATRTGILFGTRQEPVQYRSVCIRLLLFLSLQLGYAGSPESDGEVQLRRRRFATTRSVQ